MRTHASGRGGSMKHVFGQMVGALATATAVLRDALMNTSLEGSTMTTYHVSVIIETPDGNDEENEVEQALLDLAAEHMWQIVSLTVLQP